MILVPPRHSKSEFTSRRLPGFMFGINPDMQILACSYGAGLATKMSRDAQRGIDNDRYRNIFPDTKLSSKHVAKSSLGHYIRTQNEFEIVGRKGKYIAAGGYGYGIAGIGFDRGIIDDPIRGRADASSPTIRDNVWDWYVSDFRPRALKDAGIAIVATRWHRDDLCGRLLRHEPGDWTVIEFPAISTDDRHPLDERTASGQALWPAFKDIPELEKQRELDRGAFAALYQQDPRTEGGQEWPDDCFGEHIWVDEWPAERPELVLIAVDPSKGRQGRGGDYSAIVLVGVTKELLYVVADLEIRNPSQIVDDLFVFCQEHRPDMIGIEANTFQSLFVDLIRLTADKRPGWFLSNYLASGRRIIELNNTEPKVFRIRALSQYITGRQFRFIRSPGTALLVDQLRDFPLAEHDDGPDALEMAIRLPFVEGAMDADFEEVTGRIGG